MSAEITVAVDVANPGQYFACCGLLELAHRISAGAEGWFEGGLFRVRGGAEAMEALRSCEIDNTMTQEQKRRREELGAMGQKALKADAELEAAKKELDRLWRESAVMFGAPFHLRVDWFQDGRSGGQSLKTWAGKQSTIDTVRQLRALIPEPSGADWFRPIQPSKSVPLYFDSDLGGASRDLDVGFSFDPLKAIGMRVAMRPTIELLAFVGLQRFRPKEVKGEFEYGSWEAPARPELGALACCRTGRLAARVFRFRTLRRYEYYKSFLPGRPV